jgi:ABC-type transport system involved in Fe-S cluster assembly fused permease/ATPase subunit
VLPTDIHAPITEKVVAAVKSTTSLSLLNSGQAMIIALGTLFVMLLAVPTTTG